MRVLWVHNFPPQTVSSGIFMHQLAEQVREIGVEIELHYTGSLKSIANYIPAAIKIRKKSKGFDLVHAQYGSACGYLSSFAHGPKVLSLRGTDLLGSDTGSLKNRLHGRGVRLMTQKSLSNYDRIIVVSKRMSSELRDFFQYDAGIEILPSGINLKTFQPISLNAAREKLGHANDTRPWLLFSSVTKDNHVKRPQLALEAIKLAQKTRPDIVLQTLTGKPHNEVPLWVNASNLVLLTSTREGWPNIIKEGLACNTPFVSTDVSDLNYIAKKEPSCFVATEDPSSIARCILEALNNTNTLSLDKHVQEMEISKTAKRLFDIYSALLNQKLMRETP